MAINAKSSVIWIICFALFTNFHFFSSKYMFRSIWNLPFLFHLSIRIGSQAISVVPFSILCTNIIQITWINHRVPVSIWNRPASSGIIVFAGFWTIAKRFEPIFFYVPVSCPGRISLLRTIVFFYYSQWPCAIILCELTFRILFRLGCSLKKLFWLFH